MEDRYQIEHETQSVQPEQTHETPLAELQAPDAAVRDLEWVFIGPQGMRAGWSVLIFLVVTVLSMIALATLAQLITTKLFHSKLDQFTAAAILIQAVISVLAITGAAALVARLEHRRILDYNLIGSRPVLRFVSGLIAGFVALSILVGALTDGGWLRFGPISLTGAQIIAYATLWGAAFLCVGLFEEGSFRCFLQFTLARGINFWWAISIVAALCIALALRTKGDAACGVYAAALLGLVPCLLLHLKKNQSAGYWQASWVTSTLFGFTHVGNGGENWIGVLAAALIGFVFCVSVRLTGSAWWAIGFHAAWDWAETFFYGTADSGNVATGHYLTTTAAGQALWSGGTDGPEGSLLILPLLVLLLIAVIAVYGRRNAAPVLMSE